MSKEVSYKISWVTFIGNILILLHHANLTNIYPDQATGYYALFMGFFSKIAIPAMSWFFFISGYLFFRNFDMSKLIGKWKSRIFSLLIPYLIWNTLSVILQMIKGEKYFSDGFFPFIRNNYIFIFGKGCANGSIMVCFQNHDICFARPYYLLDY